MNTSSISTLALALLCMIPLPKRDRSSTKRDQRGRVNSDYQCRVSRGQPLAEASRGESYARFYDGLTLYTCPYGRVEISDRPDLELCYPARMAL